MPGVRRSRRAERLPGRLRARGFTLIEVLVALTLMAVVSLISWRALDVVQRTQERLDQSGQQVMSIVRVLGQIERDVQLHASEDVLPPAPVPAQAGQAPQVARLLLPPGVVWSSSEGLMLVRAVGDGRWQRVRWHLDGGRLMRGVGLAADTLPLPEVLTEHEVLSGVEAFSMRVWLPGQGWASLPENSGDQAGAQARAVEFRLLPAGAPQNQAYRKVVMLP